MIIERLRKIPLWKQYLITIFIMLLLVRILHLIYVKWIGLSFDPTINIVETDIFFHSLYSIFIAPPLETLIFQFIPIKFLLTYNFFKNNKYLAIIISAMLFASIHCSFFYQIIYSFHMGLILAIFFIVNDKENFGFLHVTMLHAIFNLILVIGRSL